MITLGRPPHSRYPARNKARRGGSTLLETALCLIFVLLPLCLGGLQFAMVLTTTHALQEVSREAGRFAALHYGEPTFDGSENQGNGNGGADPASLKNYLKSVAKSNKIPWDDIKNNIVVTPGVGARAAGQPITVKITYPMKKRAILGQIGFWKEKTPGDANDGRLKDGIVEDEALKLDFLHRDYSVSSTFIMQ